MPQNIVNALKGPVDRSFSLLAEFIKVCPEDIWAEKSGGWPVWQQLYHALTVVDFFIGKEGEPALPALAESEVGALRKIADRPVAKSALSELLTAVKQKADDYAASLSDEQLPAINESLFKRAKMEMSHAATLSMLAGHNLYHLGGCDAALRNNGLKGVF
jgi:uncharacterized damage-inducible protein DinB